MESVDLTEPSCDVLFLCAKLHVDGSVMGSPLGLREIVRDSGAKIVVFGLPNSSIPYNENHKPAPYGQANLPETLNRRDDAFEEFLTGVFLAMKRGLSLCTAWGYRRLLPPGSYGSEPSILFIPEIDPFTFAD